MSNHTTKGKVTLSILLIVPLGFLYHMAEAWNEGNRRLEQAQAGYAYYTPASYKPATARAPVRRLEDIEPAAGGNY